MGRKKKEKMEERERMQRRRRKKKSGAEAQGLEKLQVLRGLIDVEDGSVAVDLPNLGAQHVIILTVLCFHCWGILGGDLLQQYTVNFQSITLSFLWFLLTLILISSIKQKKSVENVNELPPIHVPAC